MARLHVINGLREVEASEERKYAYQDELITAYRELMPVRYARATIPTFMTAMKAHYCPWLRERNLFVWEVKPNVFDEFSKYLKENLKKSTQVGYTYHLANFYDWLVSRKKDEIREQYGVLVVNPIDEWNKPPKHSDENDLPPVADPEVVDFYLQREKHEFKVALEAGNSRSVNILARQMTAEYIMLKAGLRIAEVANLEVGHVHLPEMVIIVYRGKGDKDRIVDIAPSLGPMLKWYLEQGHPLLAKERRLSETTPLFLSEQRKRISKKTIQHRLWMQQVQYNIPIDKIFSPHSLRRLYATNLYKELIAEKHPDPLTYIKQQLGHVFYSTTLRYCRIPQTIVKRGQNEALESVRQNLLNGAN